MNIYLVDFENVNSQGLNGINRLGSSDRIIIFYSENADSMTFDLHEQINQSKAYIFFQKVDVGTKNALDFQLATYLGYLVCENEKEGVGAEYYVVTKDRGYSSLITYWSKRNVDITLVGSLIQSMRIQKERSDERRKEEEKLAAEAAARSKAQEVQGGAVQAPNQQGGAVQAESNQQGGAAQAAQEVQGDAAQAAQEVQGDAAQAAQELQDADTQAAPNQQDGAARAVPDTQGDADYPDAKAAAAEQSGAAAEAAAEPVPASEEVQADGTEEEPREGTLPEEVAEPGEEPEEPEEKPAKRTRSRRRTKAEQAVDKELRIQVEQAVPDKDVVDLVVSYIKKYKTKLGINNALAKEFKDSKKASEIYKSIKPLIADKKGQ